MFPSVTIMIPTYGQAHCVHKAIESALAQDYPNLEVIIADDCSPDHTEEVVKKYLQDKRVRYYRNSTNLGRVKNYKRTLEDYATGEWVINCDGDDYYIDNHFISEAIKIINSYQDQKIVFLQGGKILEFPNRTMYDLPNIDTEIQLIQGKQYFLNFNRATSFSHIATLYNRSIAKNIDFYRYDILSTDRESILRLALHGNVLLVKKAYAKWIGHEENFSQKTDLKLIKENIQFIDGSYEYALSFDLEKEALKKWKKNMFESYFRGSIGKIAINSAPLLKKSHLLWKLISYITINHTRLLTTRLIVTIGFIPFRILLTYLGIYKNAN